MDAPDHLAVDTPAAVGHGPRRQQAGDVPTRVRDVELVLLLAGADIAALAGPALAAALREVALLYGGAGPFVVPGRPGRPGRRGQVVRPRLRTTVLAPGVVAGERLGVDRVEVGSAAFDAVTRVADPAVRHHDPHALAVAVRGALRAEGAVPLLVLTDLEITGAPGTRFPVWEVVPGGAVVSTAPLDPRFWGLRAADRTGRAALMKRRARAGVASLAGQLLGLSRCANPRCFLYLCIDDPLVLDLLEVVGPEHGVEALAGATFVDDPRSPQEAARVRRGHEEGGEP